MAKSTSTTTPAVTKASKTTTSVPVVVEAASASTASAAPVKAKKASSAKKAVTATEASDPSATSSVAAAPVAATTAAATTTTDDAAVDVAELEASIAAQSVEFYAKLNQLNAMTSSIKSEFRALEKKWSRQLKTAQKFNSKRKRKTGNRNPNGFVKPTRISDELAKFLEKPPGSEMARTDVTRQINTYIKTHKLQDEKNGRIILPDATLSSLLKVSKDDELTYFNLQKFMSPHFAKAVKGTSNESTTA